MNYKYFYIKLIIAIILCSIALLTDNIVVLISCMLISPILDVIIEITNLKTINKNYFLLLLSIFIPSIFGFIISFFTEPTEMLLNISKNFYKNNILNLNLFLLSFIVAFFCGIILHLSNKEPIIATGINIACALLPQNFALGYLFGNILFKNNISHVNLYICLFITFINIFGLILGDTTYKKLLKR